MTQMENMSLVGRQKTFSRSNIKLHLRDRTMPRLPEQETVALSQPRLYFLVPGLLGDFSERLRRLLI